MNDATCPKCGKRFGWVGPVTSMPPCPRCGWTEDVEELFELEKKLEEMRRRMLSDD